ncbi:hypothetical protein O181_077536 [Austropuccinia psidii MF-1]|uniref:Uncharacterized protein n=1 Tax=Austropuccinia psidii MF-1 TaxID=1389203 RepID=A0A9Q3IC70_9BASI|nr:hypothetical protein [Austropuccinia psidii MF-1]
MGPLGPFWTKFNVAKGEVHQPPRPGGFQSQPSHTGQKGPQEPHVGQFQPMASGNDQRPPARLCLNSGEYLSFLNLPHTKGSRCGAYMV